MKKLISFIGAAVAVILCAAASMGGGWGTLPLLVLWLASAFLLGWLVFNKLPALSSDKWYLLIAGVLCVGLRVLALALFPVDTAPVHDFGTYFRLASYLAGDGPLPRTSANLFPHILFFSMALSVPFRIFGSTVFTYQLCGVALSLLSTVLLYGIVRGFVGQKAAFFGALLWAFSPTLILYAPLNCSEHLALTLTLLYIYLLFKTERGPIRNVPRLLLNGAALGLVLLALELVRPVSVILLLATLLYLPIRHWKAVKKRFLPVCGAVLAAVLVLTGGKALALRAADGILPQPLAKSSYAFTLLAGSNTEAGGAWNEADSKLFLDTMKKTYVNGYDYQSGYDALKELVRERYREMSTSDLCKLLLHKNEMLWGNQRTVVSYLAQYRDAARDSVLETHPRAVWLAGRFCDAGMIALLLLFAVACCGELRQKSATPLLWCITSVLGFVCLYCISEVSGRYTVMVYPMLYITAAPVAATFFNRKEVKPHE